MRLIDADAFFEDFPEVRDYEWVSQEYEVDAVPVVRCGECVYAIDDVDDGWIYCQNSGVGMRKSGFCSDGERRADDV